MPEYPLTTDQKQYLIELAEKFQQGMGSYITFARGDGRIIAGFASGGERISPPLPQEADLAEFHRLGLMQVISYDSRGFPERVSFPQQMIMDVVSNSFEVHPSQRQGVDARTINVDTNYGNVGIDSHFEKIVQIVNSGASTPDETKERLNALFTQLGTELKQLPKECSSDKEAIEMYAEDVANALAVDKPNQTRLKISRDGLMKAAETVSKVAPKVVETAVKISVLLAPLLANS